MADAQKGETFTSTPPGNSVTAARLNALVDALTILPAFVSAKPTTTPVTTDRALLWDASADGLISPTLAAILDLQLKDAAAATASMRTLGTGASQAAQGNLVAYLALSQTFSGTRTKFNHITGTSGATIAVGAGAGVGATAALVADSSDLGGRFSLTPAGTPTANSIQLTVTFGVPFTNTPFVIMVAYGVNAIANQATNKALAVDPHPTGFDVKSNAVALAVGTSIAYSYIVLAADL
jgi:hypothetical protein